MKKLTLIFLTICLFNGAFGLKCLSCSSHYDQCGAEVKNLYRVGQEKCSSRCFIRIDRRGILTRGCDSGYVFADDPTIPNNGCGFKNDEYWCWCTDSDLCNSVAPKKLFTYGFLMNEQNSGLEKFDKI